MQIEVWLRRAAIFAQSTAVLGNGRAMDIRRASG
jgi:hypothetical protein